MKKTITLNSPCFILFLASKSHLKPSKPSISQGSYSAPLGAACGRHVGGEGVHGLVGLGAHHLHPGVVASGEKAAGQTDGENDGKTMES